MRLRTNGDAYEQGYAKQFADREFPEYEEFWLKFVVPVTRRDEDPPDIGLKSDEGLAVQGETPEAICIAELHYSVLLHLGRTRELLDERGDGIDALFEGITHLCAALDIADELLGRFAKRNTHEPWSEGDGRRARSAWRKAIGDPCQDLRTYRNRLVHGRLVPNFEVLVVDQAERPVGRAPLFPRIGAEAGYDDWRVLGSLPKTEIEANFAQTYDILAAAWKQTLSYLREQWRRACCARSRSDLGN